MTGHSTLPEVLEANLASERKVVFIEGAEEMTTITWRDLHDRALAVLHVLQQKGLRPGDELVIHLDDNRGFLEAFWACLLGGLIPVPVALGTSDEHRFRLLRIFTRLGNPSLYTDSGTLDRLEGFGESQQIGEELARLRRRSILVDDLAGVAGKGERHLVGGGDIAWIQFSSGSTSEPKGVVLTHGNVLCNIEGMIEGLSLTPADTTLGWMPLTHDMGLVGVHFTSLVAKMDHYMMPTSLFIRRPMLWLQKVSDLGASILCSPNFGYEHFLKAFDKHGGEGLELSRVRIIVNGAEPISMGLCRRFLERMAPYGLKGSAILPVYGLAEASLAVSFPEVGSGLTAVSIDRSSNKVGEAVTELPEDDAEAVGFACVGRAIKGCEFRITGDDGAVLPDSHVGHIEIRGGNVTRGYFRDEEANRAARRQGGWLDTGDLGFVAEVGLVITGRSKEIIFAHGQNYYPHDLESIIQRECGVALGKVVVAGHRPPGADSDELLVCVVHKGQLAEFAPVAADIAATLHAQTGLEATFVVPISRIPKTTSGKVQRHLLIRAHAAGEYTEALNQLRSLGTKAKAMSHQELTETEQRLQVLCHSVIPDKNVGLHDNLFEIGTSSLELAQIHEGIDRVYPGQVDVTDLFDYPTIRDLGTFLDKKLGEQPSLESAN